MINSGLVRVSDLKVGDIALLDRDLDPVERDQFSPRLECEKVFRVSSIDSSNELTPYITFDYLLTRSGGRVKIENLKSVTMTLYIDEMILRSPNEVELAIRELKSQIEYNNIALDTLNERVKTDKSKVINGQEF